MKAVQLLVLLCVVSMKSCYGEVTGSENGENGKSGNEKDNLLISNQEIKIMAQNVKIANLESTIMAQNVKIGSLENTIMAQNVKIVNLESTILEQNVKIGSFESKIIAQNAKIVNTGLSQSVKFEKLVNQVLERRIDQIKLDYRFHERLQQEIEHRKRLNESQNALVEKVKVLEMNHSMGIQVNKETIEMNKNRIKNEVTEMQVMLNNTALVQKNVVNTQKAMTSYLDRTTSDLSMVIDNQTVIREQMGLYFEKQSEFESDIQNLVNKTEELGIQVENNKNVTQRIKRTLKFRRQDCEDILIDGNSNSGVYNISTLGPVYCDMETDGGGWTVFQHRYDGSVDFYRPWADYKAGFGNLHGEFWLGNDVIHRITYRAKYKLRIEMEDFSGNEHYAEYSTFSIADENDNYRLRIGSYSGTAGDSLDYHNNMKFSAKDKDNDKDKISCSKTFRGAWWYKNCHWSNLNGLYSYKREFDSRFNIWNRWPGGNTNMKTTTMMMRKT